MCLPSNPSVQTFPKQESCDCQKRCRREVGNMELEGPEEAIRMRGEPGNLLCKIQREIHEGRQHPNPKPRCLLPHPPAAPDPHAHQGVHGGNLSKASHERTPHATQTASWWKPVEEHPHRWGLKRSNSLSTTLISHRRIKTVIYKPKAQPGLH